MFFQPAPLPGADSYTARRPPLGARAPRAERLRETITALGRHRSVGQPSRCCSGRISFCFGGQDTIREVLDVLEHSAADHKVQNFKLAANRGSGRHGFMGKSSSRHNDAAISSCPTARSCTFPPLPGPPGRKMTEKCGVLHRKRGADDNSPHLSHRCIETKHPSIKRRIFELACSQPNMHVACRAVASDVSPLPLDSTGMCPSDELARRSMPKV